MKYNISSSLSDRDNFDRDMYNFLDDVMTDHDVVEDYVAASKEDLLETLEQIFDANEIGDLVDDAEEALARFLDIGLKVRADLVHDRAEEALARLLDIDVEIHRALLRECEDTAEGLARFLDIT